MGAVKSKKNSNEGNLIDNDDSQRIVAYSAEKYGYMSYGGQVLLSPGRYFELKSKSSITTLISNFFFDIN